MEMPGRRSNYTLLSQIPPEDHLHQAPPQPKFTAAASGGVAYYESHSGDKNNKVKGDRGGFDWDLIDHKMQGRIGATTFPASVGLQRQSSGSSFGESSISGDYFGVPSLSNPDAVFGHLFNDGELRLKGAEASGGLGGGSSSSKSWAQQTEESYQLQLALALRLSTEATCADDPNFLDPVPDESSSRFSASPASLEAMSHRFWVNGCLSYFDKVPDGFYLIHGMDPYVWTVCSDLQESGRIPSIESLRSVDPSVVSSTEVILIDRHSDSSLKELQNRIHNVSLGCVTTAEVVEQLAKLVCIHMGGVASTGEEDLVPSWRECSVELKECLGSIVLPIGNLSVGLCRHRAVLFKVLADSIDLPCRIAKGCKYCNRDDASSCLVRFGVDRECLVDLIGNPGCLCDPDSLLNGPSSISITSPLRLPRFRQVEPRIDFRLLAKQYFSDCQSLNLVFDDSSAGAIDGDDSDFIRQKRPDRSFNDRSSNMATSSNQDEIPLGMPPQNARIKGRDRESQLSKARNAYHIMASPSMDLEPIPARHVPGLAYRDGRPPKGLSEAIEDRGKSGRFVESGQIITTGPSRELDLDVEDLDIPWSDLVLKERIGAGDFFMMILIVTA
uniref:Serine/threonine-protein kinase CTR1 CTRI n=1 Tax=Gymnema sylvestre TaxID=4068 RepID=A0A976RUI4_GYMSY|nr:serine/threonine-protein kinase CTR1 CTRI [Gymnema sylvestre]